MRNQSTDKKNRRRLNREQNPQGDNEHSEQTMKTKTDRKDKKKTTPYISHQIRNIAIMSSWTK